MIRLRNFGVPPPPPPTQNPPNLQFLAKVDPKPYTSGALGYLQAPKQWFGLGGGGGGGLGFRVLDSYRFRV